MNLEESTTNKNETTEQKMCGKEVLMIISELKESIEWLSVMTQDAPYNKKVQEMAEKIEDITEYVWDADATLEYYRLFG